jgi:hypothetical protein
MVFAAIYSHLFAAISFSAISHRRFSHAISLFSFCCLFPPRCCFQRRHSRRQLLLIFHCRHYSISLPDADYAFFATLTPCRAALICRHAACHAFFR